jgi:hypothetical protein
VVAASPTSIPRLQDFRQVMQRRRAQRTPSPTSWPQIQSGATCDGRRATPFGLVCGERFEFDVIVPSGRRHEPADVHAARQATDDPSGQVVRILLARYRGPVGALATAVRRLDRPK